MTLAIPLRSLADIPEATGRTSKVRGTTAQPVAPSRASVTALAFLVGTGGLYTLNYFVLRDAKGYRLPSVDWKTGRAAESAASKESAAAKALATIRRMLPVSVTQLAATFGVSRQALYHWQRGEAISHENERRLTALADATGLLVGVGLADSSTLRRAIHDGKTFLELVADGESPVALAERLASIVRIEAEERERLERLFAGRPKHRVDLDEFGRGFPDDNASEE